MKKSDGKREEENVTLFFNQSDRRLVIYLFIFFNMEQFQLNFVSH